MLDTTPIATDATSPEGLKRLRDALGLSQADIAEEVGVRSETWGRWERGEQKPSRYFRRQLTRLAAKTRRRPA